MKNKYPLITIKGFSTYKEKGKQKIVNLGSAISKKRNYKIIKYKNGTYGINLAIRKSILRDIIKMMRRCWGRPTITTPVSIKLTFYEASYPPNASVDIDNAKQLYLDLLQADKYKEKRQGKDKGEIYLASEGAGIIKDDKIVQSTDGTRFVYLCWKCQWGFTGNRLSPVRNKVKTGCPGVIKCPDVKIEIQITDMKLDQEGFYV